jgi:hypothetical protein
MYLNHISGSYILLQTLWGQIEYSIQYGLCRDFALQNFLPTFHELCLILIDIKFIFRVASLVLSAELRDCHFLLFRILFVILTNIVLSAEHDVNSKHQTLKLEWCHRRVTGASLPGAWWHWHGQ